MSKAKAEKTVPEQVHALFATVCEEYQTAAENGVDEVASSDEASKKAKAGIKRKIAAWKKKLEALYPVNGQPPLPGMEDEPAAAAAKSEEETAASVPHELVVAARKGTDVAALEKCVGAEKVDFDGGDDAVDLVYFRFDSEKQADRAKHKIELDEVPGVLQFDVNPVTDDGPPPEPEAPPEPKDDKIELEVETGAIEADDAAGHGRRLAGLLGRDPVEKVTDGDGTSFFFEYADRIGADAGYDLAAGHEVVTNARVVDPHLERLAEEDQAELLSRPRKLVSLEFGPGKQYVTRCTRCVDLEHHPDGCVVHARRPDRICGFCGWSPEDDKPQPTT